MSNCGFTKQISFQECIGDSFYTINDNFASLDENLCNVPASIAGNGINIQDDITDRNESVQIINSRSLVTYGRTLDFFNPKVTQKHYTLTDGTSAAVYEFPYLDSMGDLRRPEATFSTVALSNKIPKVTLYWLTSGTESLTVYALNSAIDNTSRGQTWFNGSVDALCRDGNTLYVGGRFTTAGGASHKKITTISLSGGNNHPTLGKTGQIGTDPFGPEIGEIGTINDIVATKYGVYDVVAVGGSFESITYGCGLALKINNSFYQYFVKGQVNTLKLIGQHLYVGGDFNYVNYGSTSALEEDRIYSKGIFRINLNLIIGNMPNQSIDVEFSERMSTLFSSKTGVVNAIAFYQNFLYFGGKFQVRNTNRSIINQNVVSVGLDGTHNPLLKYLVNGPVYSLCLDDTTNNGAPASLYIGGNFNRIFSDSEFNTINGDNRDYTSNTEYNNIAVYTLEPLLITLETSWKPEFNGPICSIVPHSDATDTVIYVYGQFTTANGQDVSSLAVVDKPHRLTQGKVQYWNANVETSPSLVSNAFLRYTSSVLVGGTFTKVNTTNRYRLAKVSGYEESLLSTPLSSLAVDFNAQVMGHGMSFVLTNSTTECMRKVLYPNVHGSVTCTTFTASQEPIQDSSVGQLCRFFIRRPGLSNAIGNLSATNDTLRYPLNLVGWKVDYR